VDAIFRKDRNVACKNISIESISMTGDGEKKFVLLLQAVIKGRRGSVLLRRL